jgi:hypothetical protein
VNLALVGVEQDCGATAAGIIHRMLARPEHGRSVQDHADCRRGDDFKGDPTSRHDVLATAMDAHLAERVRGRGVAYSSHAASISDMRLRPRRALPRDELGFYFAAFTGIRALGEPFVKVGRLSTRKPHGATAMRARWFEIIWQ